jgi:hypothetical protein
MAKDELDKHRPVLLGFPLMHVMLFHRTRLYWNMFYFCISVAAAFLFLWLATIVLATPFSSVLLNFLLGAATLCGVLMAICFALSLKLGLWRCSCQHSRTVVLIRLNSHFDKIERLDYSVFTGYVVITILTFILILYTGNWLALPLIAFTNLTFAVLLCKAARSKALNALEADVRLVAEPDLTENSLSNRTESELLALAKLAMQIGSLANVSVITNQLARVEDISALSIDQLQELLKIALSSGNIAKADILSESILQRLDESAKPSTSTN